jgi:hypothetical protein
MASSDGNLALLHKGAGVRRSDLRRVLGRTLLGRWGLTGDDLLAMRIAAICHLENVLATFSEEKVELTARYAYNIDPGLADTTKERLEQLSQLKGAGYAQPTTEKILTRHIAPQVQTMLARARTPPTKEQVQQVAERERTDRRTTRLPTTGTSNTQVNGLRTAILRLAKPISAADHAVETFLGSTLYAPRPKDVGYVVRVTSRHGYLMCVFTSVETLKAFQRANDPDWSGEYLVMTGRDVVADVIAHLPADAGILVDPGVVDDGVSASLSLPAELLRTLNTIE